ncbi:MAG: hypothetical protein LBR25_09455 [Erysipelotrichaceae bacterium]|jgi:hypothetical protein|nr:hypothetical protein [Erysipelotrichaceae bacterium]
MKSKLEENKILCAVVFAFASLLITTAIQTFNAVVIQGLRGRPAFVTLSFMVIIFITKVLFGIAYGFLGKFMSVRNRYLRGLVFMALVWTTAYAPQTFGLAGADGAVANAIFDPPLLICDGIGYLLSGLVLGWLMPDQYTPVRTLKFSTMLRTMILCGIGLPLLVMLGDKLLYLINPNFAARLALGVSAAKAQGFHWIYFGCFIPAGLLLPWFYRLTAYNSDNLSATWEFAISFVLLIWTPLVVIVIAFGANLFATLFYALMFILILWPLTWFISKMETKPVPGPHYVWI